MCYLSNEYFFPCTLHYSYPVYYSAHPPGFNFYLKYLVRKDKNSSNHTKERNIQLLNLYLRKLPKHNSLKSVGTQPHNPSSKHSEVNKSALS